MLRFALFVRSLNERETVMKKADEVYLDVTEEQFRQMQARGIDEDALLAPGRHKFTRGLFKQMHSGYAPQQASVSVTVQLDADLLAWLRARAAQCGAASYQAQLNAELRALLEQEATAKPVLAAEPAKRTRKQRAA